MKLSIDQDRVIADGETCSAHQIEEVIQRLSLIRAQMQPPVPNTLPQDGVTTAQHNPTLALRLSTDGNIGLSIRHNGIGWILFTLPVRQAEFLRDGLIKRTGGNVEDIPTVNVGTKH